VWHVPEPLDVDAMNEAVGHLAGTHDFASFCRKAPGRSTEREVTDVRWQRDGDLLEMWITALAFCHHMVRSIVGTSVHIGRGRTGPGAMAEVLAARDRSASHGSAPPQGLTLIEVTYPPHLNPGLPNPA
jgi:tRNA pseudouridine38-40 synthase